MWLLKKLAPDFKPISDFRKDNKQAIKRVCREFMLLCNKLGLFGGELIAIDGGKFKAVNSKKRNFNQQKLKKKIKEIEEKMEDYFKGLEENGIKESSVSSETAKELKAKIELLKNRKRKYQNLLKRLKESGETQVSLTDADATAMANNQKIEVCYNVQMAVDEKHELILDYEVTNEVKDTDQLSKMAKQAKEILEVEKLEVLVDKGYFNANEIKECLDNKITPYIPKPKSTVSKEVNVPEPESYKEKFNYNATRDVYICPAGYELTYKNSAKHHGKIMRIYKTKECMNCPYKGRCTRNPKGRVIYR